VSISSIDDEDQFIDAGLELPPGDLQNLPDLSYEELKFLNEIDADNGSIDDIEVCDLDDPTCNTSESFLFSQSFPLFSNSKHIENNKKKSRQLLSSSFSYKPKFRNILKQQPATATLNKKRKLDSPAHTGGRKQLTSTASTTVTAPIEKQKKSKDSSSPKKNRKKSDSLNDSSVKSSPTKKQSTTRHKLSLSSSLSSSSSASNIFNVRQNRNRSTSSSHSSITSSSNLSFNDSNSGDQSGNLSKSCSSSSSNSAHYYNYYISNPHNKFDINNIVIPHDMLSNSKQVHYEIKNLHVPTPRWRLLELDEPVLSDELPAHETNEQLEALDDLTFINRHKLKELKERDSSLKLKNNKIDHRVKKNKSNSLSSPDAAAAAFLPSHEPPKTAPVLKLSSS